MIENLYCKIFVDTVEEYSDFFETVRKFVNGQKTAISGIVSEWCDMSVRKNKEYITDSSDFLYWKFIIDLEPQKNISETAYINNIRNFIYFLKQENKVICACDFEELL